MAAAEASVIFIEFDCGLGSDHFNRHGREKSATVSLGETKSVRRNYSLVKLSVNGNKDAWG